MIKKLFYPFGEVNKATKIGITVFWIVVGLGWFELGHSKLIPPPSKIAESLWSLVNSRGFYDDLVASLITTLKAMGYSILLTVLIVYSSTIQMFSPLAEFISKCRYLTLTGLVFVFTVISNNISDVKMYLLIFGITPFFVTSFLSAVKSTPPQQIHKGYVNKLGRWGTLLEVIIIGKLDVLFEVMRQNFAISWMMITMVEGYAMNEGGIGTLLIKSNKYLNLAPVFAMLLIILVLGLLFDVGLGQLRRFLFPHIKTKT